MAWGLHTNGDIALMTHDEASAAVTPAATIQIMARPMVCAL